MLRLFGEKSWVVPEPFLSYYWGPLGRNVYKLEQLHFHFGCDDNKGSEHTVDGNAYLGEVRM